MEVNSADGGHILIAGVAGTCDAAEEVEAPRTAGGSVGGGLGGLCKVGSAGDAALPSFVGAT